MMRLTATAALLLIFGGVHARQLLSSSDGDNPLKLDDAYKQMKKGPEDKAAADALGSSNSTRHGFMAIEDLLGSEWEDAGVVYVPEDYTSDDPMPLLLFLTGGGSSPRAALRSMDDLVGLEDVGAIIVAPRPAAGQWDVGSEMGEDVQRIDELLAEVFKMFAVQAERTAAVGFSDGASQALALGLANPEVFRYVIAWSPMYGTGPALEYVGQPSGSAGPAMYISFGDDDSVVNLDAQHRLVDGLKQVGYPVKFDEFNGGHTVPPTVLDASMRWLL